MQRKSMFIAVTLIAGLVTATAWAQNLGDQDFAPSPSVQVNSITALSNTFPAIDIDPNGNYVVTWRQNSIAVNYRRFDANLVPQAGAFVVNNSTNYPVHDPDVCVDANGDFVVTWINDQCCTSSPTIERRSNVSDAWTGFEEQLNVQWATGDVRKRPAIDCQDSQNFIVVWQGTTSDDGNAIAARQVVADVPQGAGEFRVNTYTANPNKSPSIGMDAAGDFVVAWGQDDSDIDNPLTARGPSQAGITTRRYLADGTALDASQQLIHPHLGSVYSIDVARQADVIGGDYAVSWEDTTASGQANLRRYSAGGIEIGNTSFTPTGSYSGDIHPLLVFDGPNGELLLSTGGPDGVPPEYQRYDDPLTEHGDPWQGPGYTNRQRGYDIVARPNGGWAIVWSEGSEIYIQQWVPSLFADGFESGDTTEWD